MGVEIMAEVGVYGRNWFTGLAPYIGLKDDDGTIYILRLITDKAFDGFMKKPDALKRMIPELVQEWKIKFNKESK
jgi:hypothetical protein